MFCMYAYMYMHIQYTHIHTYIHIYIFITIHIHASTVITFIILILIHSYLVVYHHVFPSIVVWVCAPLDNPCSVCAIFLHKMQEIRNTVHDITIWRKTLDTQFMFSVRILGDIPLKIPEAWASHRPYTIAGIPNLSTCNCLSCLVVQRMTRL